MRLAPTVAISGLVAEPLLLGVADPAEPAVPQAIFGMIVTMPIALGFNHTPLGVLERHRSIVQVRTVVPIALLAIARKFLILDPKEVEHTTLLGLAGAAQAPGGVCWLVGDQDRRDTEAVTASDGNGGKGA